jgi:hypothetical protein
MACERYLGAFLSLNEHTVCGYKLRPFSLRHRQILEAIESPYLPGGNVINPRPADLVLAARVCSIPDPFQAVRHTIWDNFRIIRLTNSRRLYAEAEAAWVAYIRDTATHPRVGGKPPKHKRDRGLEWPLSVVVALMEMGFTEEQAWTMPEGKALYYYFAKAIREGADLDITTSTMEGRLPEAKAAIANAIAKAQARAAANPRPKAG